MIRKKKTKLKRHCVREQTARCRSKLNSMRLTKDFLFALCALKPCQTGKLYTTGYLIYCCYSMYAARTYTFQQAHNNNTKY